MPEAAAAGRAAAPFEKAVQVGGDPEVIQPMGRVGSALDCEHDPPAWWVSATTLAGCQWVAA